MTENPFGKMKKVAVRANRTRDYFVTRAEADAVLAACPNLEWQLIFVLSRYGGLRCPSEHLALVWGDVDWELDRMTVHSPKTEHHDGKELRVIPLFPELRQYLKALYNEVKPSIGCSLSSPIITRYRESNTNLRTQLHKIIRRAGLAPWPNLFKNLRASRETELAEVFPIHVVCEWIGNSQAVARRHYLQVTAAHFGKATEDAQHSAQQTASECGGTEENRKEGQCENVENFVTPRHLEAFSMGDTGFEPVTSAV